MTPRVRWLLPFVVAVSLCPRLAHSQAPGERWRTWVAAGVGGGSSRDEGGVAAVAAIAVQRAPHQFALRGTTIVDPFNEGCGQGLGDIEALYGRTVIRRHAHATLMTGAALTYPSACRSTSANRPTVLGVPLVAEVALQPAPVFGIGMQLFANVNRIGSFGGVALIVQLGWLPFQ